MAKVKNINGTSQAKCICRSWLKHWEKFSGQKTIMCVEIGCTETDLAGAHVQKAYSTDRNWYIIPLCSKHIASKWEIEILNIYNLVPADKKKTCEKSE